MELTQGKMMYELAEKLFPIYRSITGDGVRRSLKIINEYISSEEYQIHEVPTGTQVFDWTVPKEWHINDAFIEREGRKIISYKDNCLHVMGYSAPTDKVVSLDELLEYIHTQPEQPEVIPYVTSYYSEKIGFCMSEKQKESLKPGDYHIQIDSKLFEGTLSYADLIMYGETKDEVLISTYCCHPSMANDNCSGMVLLAEMAKYVKSMKDRHYTYRFVIVPETIGAITYLSQNDNLSHMRKHVKAGFVLSCVGDDGNYSIINSKTGDTLSDRVLMRVLEGMDVQDRYKRYSFLERGSDERQYNAAGVDLGVVGYCRTKYWEFPEYHTSLDTMDCISAKGLQGSYDVMKKVIETLEYNKKYEAMVIGEPQLGKRGLYPSFSQKGTYNMVAPMLDFLSFADGTRDLVEISELIKQPIDRLIPIIDLLIKEKLLKTREERGA